MLEKNKSNSVLDAEEVELRGFAKSMAQIEWLLLLLVILYYVAPGSNVVNPFGLVLSMLLFAGCILLFHYVKYETPNQHWKLAIETWVMILFITWTLWNTGSTESPLFNLYLLVIIASAITLGKLITFLEIALIAAFYFFLAYRSNIDYTLVEFSLLMIYFAPFLLVAYIATMLVADVYSGRKVLKLLSETDDMTGVFNKRSFTTMLNTATVTALKYNHPLTVMMIDADNLKTVNDVHGHGAGDELIIAVANAIRASLRGSDIVCRYGGDEFVALMPQAPAEQAARAAERIRTNLAKAQFEVNGALIIPSVSVGIATYPENVTDINELMHKADEALYESKRAGKGQATTCSNELAASTA